MSIFYYILFGQNLEFEKAREQLLLLLFCMDSNRSPTTVFDFLSPHEQEMVLLVPLHFVLQRKQVIPRCSYIFILIDTVDSNFEVEPITVWLYLRGETRTVLKHLLFRQISIHQLHFDWWEKTASKSTGFPDILFTILHLCVHGNDSWLSLLSCWFCTVTSPRTWTELLLPAATSTDSSVTYFLF
jgi:hypothetical protein